MYVMLTERAHCHNSLFENILRYEQFLLHNCSAADGSERLLSDVMRQFEELKNKI